MSYKFLSILRRTSTLFPALIQRLQDETFLYSWIRMSIATSNIYHTAPRAEQHWQQCHSFMTVTRRIGDHSNKNNIINQHKLSRMDTIAVTGCLPTYIYYACKLHKLLLIFFISECNLKQTIAEIVYHMSLNLLQRQTKSFLLYPNYHEIQNIKKLLQVKA